MLDDRRLIDRLKQGDREALRSVYTTYKDVLLTLAFSMMHDMNAAEDILHDVFVGFAGCVDELDLRTSLRQYLIASMLNRARDRFRRDKTHAVETQDLLRATRAETDPQQRASLTEETQRLAEALVQLPLEQREVILLKLNAGLRFKQIAQVQRTSVSTVQGRYRYGIDKLRSLLGGGSVE